MPLRQITTRVATILSRASEGIAAALLLLLVVVNGVAVFYRFVLNSPVGWSEEIMRFCVIWLTFIAAGAVLRAGEHITLDIAGGLTSLRLQAALASVVFLVILGFCLIIAVLGYQVAMRNQMQVSAVLEISMMWPYMAIPVGAGLAAIEAVLLLLASVSRVFKPD